LNCKLSVRRIAFFALTLLVAYPSHAAEDTPVGFFRFLSGDDFAKGTLVGCTKSGQIAWQCKEFDRPLEIDVIHLKRLETGVALSPTWEDGSFDFEINGSDSLNGLLIGADSENLRIRSPILGDVDVPLSRLTQMRRIEAPHDVLFTGLASDPLLMKVAESSGWKLKGQSLVAEKSSKRMIGNFHLDAFSRIDLRLSWEGSPQFVLAFGVDEFEASIGDAPHIELWDRGLVLVQQIKGQADATFLHEIADAESDLALTIYQDQTNGQIAILSSTGNLLGKIQLNQKSNAIRSSIAFANQGSTLSIDAITVSKWDRVLPYPYGAESDDSQPFRRDITGNLKRFDASSGIVTLETKDSEDVSIQLNELATFVPLAASQSRASQTSDAGLPRVLVTLSDSSQISGELAPAERGFLNIKTKYSEKAYACPTHQVISMRKLSDAITALPAAGKRVKLRLDGIELSGQLAEMPLASPSSMLLFQPLISNQPVGIRESAHGSISPSRANTTLPIVSTNLRIQGNVRIILPAEAMEGKQKEESDPSLISTYRTPRGLQLRSGELIDATVESIDESGVKFLSPATSATFLPNDAMQSAQLNFPQRGVPIDVKKMERLLTVPRMRRDYPPTHLIITTSGDYLRGRLKRLSKESIEFEEGLSMLTIPRNSAAVIIWLHDRSWESADAKNEAASGKNSQEEAAFQVHIKLRSTGRFTFQPERIEKEILYGTSPLLGAVNVALSNIDSLEFGKSIIQRIAEREENAWRLNLAKSPLVFEENDANGLPKAEQLGTGSDLVGKPAPNFELKSISGQPWRLGNQRGKVTVLDFWASWCGPCMHAMPQVERIVTDLGRDDIQWVGINLQETSERAQISIDRLNIQSLVLLDEEGKVGSEYEAQAIPLTVIIDRDGIVRHVFIGGGDETLAAIEKAIQSFTLPL